jgi:tetrahydromethanopterin S-methyltransferase subunit G
LPRSALHGLRIALLLAALSVFAAGCDLSLADVAGEDLEAPAPPAAPSPVAAPAAQPEPVGAPAPAPVVPDAPTGEVPVVLCPSVADKLPVVPPEAQAEVDRELANLERTIDDTNARLASSVGQGGPALDDNIVISLEGKRFAILERIEIAIGRHAARPVGLTALADCELVGGSEPGAAPAPTAAPAPAPAPASGVPTVDCPSVADKLPAVPPEAQAEVDRELANLERTIANTNARLASSVGQGGPALDDNIVIDLEGKRFAILERIEIAIGRHAPRPTGLTELAPCGLS